MSGPLLHIPMTQCHSQVDPTLPVFPHSLKFVFKVSGKMVSQTVAQNKTVSELILKGGGKI